VDAYEIAQVIAGKPENGWRWVQGTVVSVQAYSITVTLAGGSANVAGVKYLSPVPPLPGAGVWLVSDGKALLAVGMTAAAGRSIAPRAFRNNALTLTTATDTTVTWEADESDAYGFWDSGAATVLTCKVPGRYMAVGDARFAANATGIRAAWIELNTTTTVGRVRAAATATLPAQITVTSQAFTMAINDTVRMRVEQTSGGNLDLLVSGSSPSLSLIYLGP
jgi:hypothetical protein